MDIASRIQELIRKNQLNAAKFADRIGVQRSNLSHVLTGRNKPGLDFIEKVLIEFPNIDANWLISGYKSVENKQEEAESTASSSDDSIVSKSVQTFSERSVYEKPKKLDPLPKSEVKVDKIIVFYNDGTFEEFKK